MAAAHTVLRSTRCSSVLSPSSPLSRCCETRYATVGEEGSRAGGAGGQWAKQGDEETGSQGRRRVAGGQEFVFSVISHAFQMSTWKRQITSSMIGLVSLDVG